MHYAITYNSYTTFWLFGAANFPFLHGRRPLAKAGGRWPPLLLLLLAFLPFPRPLFPLHHPHPSTPISITSSYPLWFFYACHPPRPCLPQLSTAPSPSLSLLLRFSSLLPPCPLPACLFSLSLIQGSSPFPLPPWFSKVPRVGFVPRVPPVFPWMAQPIL